MCPGGYHLFRVALTHWRLRDVEVILQVYMSDSFYEFTSSALYVRLVLG